jgi:hypothetical protein
MGLRERWSGGKVTVHAASPSREAMIDAVNKCYDPSC